MRRIPALVFVLFLLAAGPLLGQDIPATPEAIMKQAQALAARGQQTEAAALLDKGLEAFPHHSGLQYDKACLWARSGNAERALALLAAAIDNGFDDLTWIEQDPDLDSLRSRPQFVELTQKLKTRVFQSTEAHRLVLDAGTAAPFTLGTPGKEPWADVKLRADHAGLIVHAELHKSRLIQDAEGWEKGDGLVLFVGPISGESAFETARFDGFGFHSFEGKGQGFVLAQEGRAIFQFSPILTPKVVFQNGVTTFDVTIPWELTPTIRPPLDRVIGFNLAFNLRGKDGNIQTLVYLPDPHMEPSFARWRHRFAPIELRWPPTGNWLLSGELASRLPQPPVLSFKIGVAGPVGNQTTLTVTVGSAEGAVWSKEEVGVLLTQPVMQIAQTAALPSQARGVGLVKVQVKDGPSWTERFFIPDPTVIQQCKKLEADWKQRPPGPVLNEALLGLRYWIERFENKSNQLEPRDNPFHVAEAYAELESWLRDNREPEKRFLSPGEAMTALRSSFDGSLQPFWIQLPPDFDPGRTYPLVVFLHGAGGEPKPILPYMVRFFEEPSAILAGTRGRSLRDWFENASERDLFDMIEQLKSAYRIDKVLLFGHSMGGTAAWRLALNYPDRFSGTVVWGAPVAGPWVSGTSHDPLPLFGRAQNHPFLVIHGYKDPVVPIAPVDDWVKKLKKAGYNVDTYFYREGGHNDFPGKVALHRWWKQFRTKPAAEDPKPEGAAPRG